MGESAKPQELDDDDDDQTKKVPGLKNYDLQLYYKIEFDFKKEFEEQKKKDQEQFDLLRTGAINEIFAEEFAASSSGPTSDYTEDFNAFQEDQDDNVETVELPKKISPAVQEEEAQQIEEYIMASGFGIELGIEFGIEFGIICGIRFSRSFVWESGNNQKNNVAKK